MFKLLRRRKKEKKAPRSDSTIDLGDGFLLLRKTNPTTTQKRCLLMRDGLNSSIYVVSNHFDERRFVKVFPVERDNTEEIEKFHEEIGTHPNIVPFLRRVHFEGSRFSCLVYDHVKGSDLLDYINHRPLLEEYRCQQYIHQLVSAVAHIHSKGLIHGDIRPENLLISARPNKLVLCDFEFCRRWTPGVPMVKQSGTLSYCSPEMLILGKPFIGPETDVWAIAVTAYIIMFKHNPWTPTYSNFLPNILDVKENILTLNWRFPFEKRMPSKNFMRFIKLCLVENASERPTCEQLLEHPWLRGMLGASSSVDSSPSYFHEF